MSAALYADSAPHSVHCPVLYKYLTDSKSLHAKAD